MISSLIIPPGRETLRAVTHGCRSVFAILLSFLLSGCATSKAARFEKHVQQLQAGVTTKEQVMALFGQPKQYRQNSDGSSDYAYTKARANTIKGATAGTLIMGGLAAVPCIVLAPFTFGASLLWWPALAGLGGVVGGVGGTAVNSPVEILIIHCDKQGVVQNYQVTPANANERVFGLQGN